MAGIFEQGFVWELQALEKDWKAGAGLSQVKGGGSKVNVSLTYFVHGLKILNV